MRERGVGGRVRRRGGGGLYGCVERVLVGMSSEW